MVSPQPRSLPADHPPLPASLYALVPPDGSSAERFPQRHSPVHLEAHNACRPGSPALLLKLARRIPVCSRTSLLGLAPDPSHEYLQQSPLPADARTLFGRSHALKQIGFRPIRSRDNIGKDRFTLGYCTCFVEHHGLNLLCRLQMFAALEQMPYSAARPDPAMTEVGVASPSAHGQAMTSTAIAFSREPAKSPGLASRYQIRNVSALRRQQSEQKCLK